MIYLRVNSEFRRNPDLTKHHPTHCCINGKKHFKMISLANEIIYFTTENNSLPFQDSSQSKSVIPIFNQLR